MIINHSLSSLDTNDVLFINRQSLIPLPLNLASFMICIDQ